MAECVDIQFKFKPEFIENSEGQKISVDVLFENTSGDFDHCFTIQCLPRIGEMVVIGDRKHAYCRVKNIIHHCHIGHNGKPKTDDPVIEYHWIELILEPLGFKDC
jgi:hypothetical protein